MASPIRFWLLPVMFISTVLTHLGGGSAGREGAALQMGGTIGWWAGGVLHLNEHERRMAVQCRYGGVLFRFVQHPACRQPFLL